MILLICTWKWAFMEEWKRPAGKGAERGAIKCYLDYCIFIIAGGQNLNRNWISINCTALVATIISQHCLNPLGHGVHQSFTGCHWSPLSLLHDDITELVDVRDLALLHLPFEDAPQMLNRVKVWRHAWACKAEVVIMLEYCPASQFPKEGDHALLQYITIHVGIHGSLNEL